MNSKKNIIILIISIFTYFIIASIYSNVINKSDYIDVYVLNKNVSRGESLNQEDLKKVRILRNETLNDDYNVDINNKYVYKDSLYKNQIIYNNILINKNDYVSTSSEIVTIKLDSIEDAASYQLEKGSIVNIFYTSKTSDVTNILSAINKQNMIIGSGSAEFVTIKIFENIKILNVFNKDGNIIKKDENLSVNKSIATVNIEISKEEAMLFNSLKNKGKFSITVLR